LVARAEPSRECDGGEDDEGEQPGQEAEPQDVADDEVDAGVGVSEAGDPAEEEQRDVDDDGGQQDAGSEHGFLLEDDGGQVDGPRR
jgi:hypothetical protein